jgi:ParB/RepB/Spo0J family partition protein
MADQVTLIDPQNIKPNVENPRIVFREEELLALENSIKDQGILVPLTVFSDRTKYTILDGERRWRCAIKLGLRRVPAIVQPKPDRLQNIMMMFAIHKTRSDWDPLPTARKLAQLEAELTKRHGGPPTESALAAAASLTRGEVRRYRRILALPAMYQDELMAELEKPRSEQILTVDHVLEASRGSEALLSRGIISEEVADKLTNAIVDKFRLKTERNTVAPRHLPAIARAVQRGDVDAATVRRIVTRIISQPAYTVERAFQDIGAEPESRKAIGSLADRIVALIDDHVDRGFAIDDSTGDKLRTLAARIRRLLAN